MDSSDHFGKERKMLKKGNDMSLFGIFQLATGETGLDPASV
jgi:hypothetical protein